VAGLFLYRGSREPDLSAALFYEKQNTGYDMVSRKAKKRKARKKNGQIAAELVVAGQKEAAAYAGVSVRTIRNWKAAGMPVAADGGYIKNLLDFYKNNEGKQPTEEKKQALSADADYKTVRAKLLAMELAVKQGELVSIKEIEKGRVARILAVKRALLGLGRKFAPRLVHIKDERKMAAVINEQMKEIIRRFSGQ
jgi:phage terminase Nu1 subunit (DNA packaging protein)